MTDVLELRTEDRGELDGFEGMPPAPTPVTTQRQQIRDIFKDLGGMVTTRNLARVCLQRGVWNETDQQVILLRSAQSQVRAALSSEDASGLPFAGQTTQREESGEGHARVWKARQMWLFADYELNVNIRAAQMERLDHTVQGLSQECEDRYGRAPEITVSAAIDEEADEDA